MQVEWSLLLLLAGRISTRVKTNPKNRLTSTRQGLGLRRDLLVDWNRLKSLLTHRVGGR